MKDILITLLSLFLFALCGIFALALILFPTAMFKILVILSGFYFLGLTLFSLIGTLIIGGYYLFIILLNLDKIYEIIKAAIQDRFNRDY